MNVCECVINGAKWFPDQDAIVFEDQKMTYAQLEQFSAQAACVLSEQGLRRGDRVGIVLPNVPAFAVWYYAALRLGAVSVSISTRLAADEVAFILADCQARLLVTDAATEPAFAESLPECVEHHLAVAESGDDCRVASPADGAAWVNTEPDEPAVILYTSGTTGFPKGATLSHRNIRATVHAFNHLCRMNRDDRLLLSVPLFHCYGQNALLNSGLQVGATLILQRRFDLNESKRLISEQRVTKLFGVPTTFQLLSESCEPTDLATVDYCFSAAATLPIQVSRRWQEKFGMPIYEGYGLTETAPFASYNHPLRHVPGSIGVPVDLVEMKVVDPDTGEPCPPGEPGEIAIRGPNVMLRYWNRPEETEAAIRDGWFFSGDMGRVEEDGYFYIVDRLKDMISVGGTKVFPAEVERVLLDEPTVAEAAVVGFADPVLGEKVVAFLVSAAGATNGQPLRRHCQRHLADYKVPRQIVWCDALPRNPAGKVLKTQLREMNLAEMLSEEFEELDQGAPRGATQVHATLPTDSHLPPFVDMLRDVHLSAQHGAVVTHLQELLKDMLGTDEPPNPQEPLVETGIDSLTIVELRDRLQQQIGAQADLPATIVFDYPRLTDLASYLLETVRNSEAEDDSRVAVSSQASRSPAANVSTVRSDAEATAHTANDDINSMSEQQALAELIRELKE